LRRDYGGREDQNWKRHISSIRAKVWLYNVYVLPVLIMVLKSGQSLSLLLGDLTLLTHGLSVKSPGSRIPDTSPTLLSGRLPAACPPVSRLIRERRLRFLGRVARADPKQGHWASLQPSSHWWRRPCGRPCTTWAIDTDVQQQWFRATSNNGIVVVNFPARLIGRKDCFANAEGRDTRAVSVG